MPSITALATRLTGKGNRDELMDAASIREIVRSSVEEWPVRAPARVLGIIPDKTRTFSPQVIHELLAACQDRGLHLDFLIATGTHAPMTDAESAYFLKSAGHEDLFRNAIIANHTTDPSDLVSLGTLEASEVRELSGGLLTDEIPVRMNRMALEYDMLVVIGPVFPHEVIGMSGGWKYFFPGISGAELIDHSHWLGALHGIGNIIGRSETPVRRLVERAGMLVLARRPVSCFSLVLGPRGLHGLFHGDPVESHRAAARLSRDVNVVWTDRRYKRVVAQCPAKYDELWTGGKLAYKTQEVVKLGGQIVLHAPHLDLIAPQHPDVEKIGYHCLDYFTGQWERFKNTERSSLAHSTHVSGPGVYQDGVETLHARRVLASKVSPAHCASINLDYLPPESIDFTTHRPFGDDEDTLWVPQAGEQLYLPGDKRHEFEQAVDS
jgi:nickel-dependent lactate racemase